MQRTGNVSYRKMVRKQGVTKKDAFHESGSVAIGRKAFPSNS